MSLFEKNHADETKKHKLGLFIENIQSSSSNKELQQQLINEKENKKI